ncbi:MAG: hypothetical protein ABI556_10540, partial [Gemmatimonadales bacterium]
HWKLVAAGSSVLPAVSTPGLVAVRSEMIAAPNPIPVVAEVMERTGDSTRTQPGVPKGRRRTGRFVTVNMPVYDRFKPTLTVQSPSGYFIPAADTQVVRVLRTHGITVDATRDAAPTGVEVFHIDSAVASTRPFQGHREMRLTGSWRTEQVSIPAGTYLVRVDQPLGLLAVYLLEPQSDDGLVTWNYFDRELRPGGTYPVLKTQLPLGMVH